MNLPNKLTVLRMCLVPFFIASMLIAFPHHYLLALLFFLFASVTDLMDGKIARKKNLITDFGKFLDPLADKILVISALVCFVSLGLCGSVLVIVVLFREFTVTSVRLMAAAKGKIVPANIFGKIKTVTQMIAIILVFVLQYILELMSMGVLPAASGMQEACRNIFPVVNEIALWISTVFAVISGVIYVYQNKEFLRER